MLYVTANGEPSLSKIPESGALHVIHSVFIERLLLISILLLAECLQQDIGELKENTSA